MAGPGPAIAVALLAGLSLAALWFGLRALRRRRLIENIPTSKVAGVCLGLTELKGEALRRTPLRSYLAEIECVYYRFTVEEHWRRTETYTDSEGKTRTRTESGWSTVRSGGQRVPFRLRDETGEIRIDPDGAEIDAERVFSRSCTPWDPLYYEKGPRFAIPDSTHRRRFTEWAIPQGARVYVMGTARLRKDALAPEIGRDPDDPLFLISTATEQALLRRYRWQSALLLPLGAAAAVGLPLVLGPLEITAGPLAPWVAALSGLGYLGVVAAAYLQTVYNGLVDLRNRVRNAWSMIDVELKRRHDLIPNLARVVAKYAEHEKEVQQRIAELRAIARGGPAAGIALPDANATVALARLADSQSEALGALFAQIERYPELRANEQFARLAEQIARTEHRIALLRSFYNESVTAYNNRLDTFPDVLIARPLRFETARYFEIAPFEKQPITIDLSEHEDDETPDAAAAIEEHAPPGARELDEQERAALRERARAERD